MSDVAFIIGSLAKCSHLDMLPNDSYREADAKIHKKSEPTKKFAHYFFINLFISISSETARSAPGIGHDEWLVARCGVPTAQAATAGRAHRLLYACHQA